MHFWWWYTNHENIEWQGQSKNDQNDICDFIRTQWGWKYVNHVNPKQGIVYTGSIKCFKFRNSPLTNIPYTLSSNIISQPRQKGLKFVVVFFRSGEVSDSTGESNISDLQTVIAIMLCITYSSSKNCNS